MIIITSAAYVSDGLVAEFGKIPPAMLPYESKRLYEHQIKLFNHDEDIYLTLPDDYDITFKDILFFDSHNVKVIKVPNTKNLGQSIVYTLNLIGKYNKSVKILHGDTLFTKIPEDNDSTLVSIPQVNYSWAFSSHKNLKYVYAGFFNFKNQSDLIQSISLSNFDFIEGCKLYSDKNPIKEIYTDNWLDFGLPVTYHRSKSTLTTERHFNNLEISKFSVIKHSHKVAKIKAEANWFLTMPNELKGYIPSLWNQGIKGSSSFYEIEYLSLNTLADLFVFGKHPVFVWKSILNACNEFISVCHSFKKKSKNLNKKYYKNMYLDKTLSRIEEYVTNQFIDLDKNFTINGVMTPSIKKIINEMYLEVSKKPFKNLSIIHGDFCLSNILFDFRTQSIKVIDPRGLDYDENISIYGDARYDIAKLSHSIIGLYDFIISGDFELKSQGDYSYELKFLTTNEHIKIQQLFKNSNFLNNTIYELSVYPIMILLFLSMLPLHFDRPKRQNAMLANALRLFVEYKNLQQ